MNNVPIYINHTEICSGMFSRIKWMYDLPFFITSPFSCGVGDALETFGFADSEFWADSSSPFWLMISFWAVVVLGVHVSLTSSELSGKSTLLSTIVWFSSTSFTLLSEVLSPEINVLGTNTFANMNSEIYIYCYQEQMKIDISFKYWRFLSKAGNQVYVPLYRSLHLLSVQ